jgi:RNA polymerase sigma-70 factor (ECF subfamily)
MLGDVSSSSMPPVVPVLSETDDVWLDAFRRGDRAIIEQCYRQYYPVVEAAIGTLLGAADRETVVHEVFFRLLTDKGMRASFSGASLGAWLATVARNRAVDLNRRARWETLVSDPLDVAETSLFEPGAHEQHVMRLLLDRFRREHLPAEWAPVFEVRFLRQMTQREAARYLGIRRTTLAYRELQLRRRLKAFMLAAEEP